MTRLIGYARTSTLDQVAGLDAQIRDLTAAGCEVIYNEQVSSVGEREQFEDSMAELRAGDRLVVTKLDRLARSILTLWQIIDRLDEIGAGLRILNFGGEVIDTKSATGRLILTMFAGFAQFERETMLERQKEGIKKAKAEGKYKGRPVTIGKKAPEIIFLAQNTNLSLTEIGKQLGMSRASVGRILGEKGINHGRVVGYSCRPAG